MPKDEKNTAIYAAYDDYEGLDPALPERNLLRAILLSAMSDIRRNGEAARKASEYFLNPSEDYIFSFRSVCNHLEIDPATILRVVGLSNGHNNGHANGSSIEGQHPFNSLIIDKEPVDSN